MLHDQLCTAYNELDVNMNDLQWNLSRLQIMDNSSIQDYGMQCDEAARLDDQSNDGHRQGSKYEDNKQGSRNQNNSFTQDQHNKFSQDQGNKDFKQDQGADPFNKGQPQLERQTPEPGCGKDKSVLIRQGCKPRNHTGSSGSRNIKQDQGADPFNKGQPQLERQTPEPGCGKYKSVLIRQGCKPRNLKEMELCKQWERNCPSKGLRHCKESGQRRIKGRTGMRRVKMVTQQEISRDKDVQSRRCLQSAMDLASMGAERGPQELVRARGTGQDTPR